MEAGYADWAGLQQWTYAELSYFSEGQAQRERQRDARALAIAAAAQSPEGFKAFMHELNKP